MTTSLRIGVFDSGVGGLTVARALADKLPEASLIYVGDNAHMPYGGKSATAVRHYASRITQWLVQQQCDAVVVACHSATSIALESVRLQAGVLPVMNVVDPMLDQLQQYYSGARVVLIGTRHTIGSDIYSRSLQARGVNLELISVATPVLASLVEEGFVDVAAVRLVWDRYLSHIDWSSVDALVLGCTHYPLLIPSLKKVVGEQVDLLDPAVFLAEQMQQWRQAAASPVGSDSQSSRFYLTDRADQFISIAEHFFNRSLSIQELKLWD